MPRRISSPSDRRADVMRLPCRYVPFLLSRSSSVASPLETTMLRVVARDAGGIALDRRIRRAADDVDPVHQHDVPVLVDETRPRAGRRRRLGGVRLHHLADEAVAEPVHRAEKNRLRRGIVEGAANLRHEPGEIRFLDERRRPQPLLELGLRHRAVAVDQQERQQFERFRRKMNLVAAGEHLPRVVVEHEAAEAIRHAGHCIRRPGRRRAPRL